MHPVLAGQQYQITHSHGTVVRDSFKDDEASQWKRPKFEPSPRQNPLTDHHQDCHSSWMAPGVQNFVAICLRASAPQIRDFAEPLGPVD